MVDEADQQQLLADPCVLTGAVVAISLTENPKTSISRAHLLYPLARRVAQDDPRDFRRFPLPEFHMFWKLRAYGFGQTPREIRTSKPVYVQKILKNFLASVLRN